MEMSLYYYYIIIIHLTNNMLHSVYIGKVVGFTKLDGEKCFIRVNPQKADFSIRFVTEFLEDGSWWTPKVVVVKGKRYEMDDTIWLELVDNLEVIDVLYGMFLLLSVFIR